MVFYFYWFEAFFLFNQINFPQSSCSNVCLYSRQYTTTTQGRIKRTIILLSDFSVHRGIAGRRMPLRRVYVGPLLLRKTGAAPP